MNMYKALRRILKAYLKSVICGKLRPISLNDRKFDSSHNFIKLAIYCRLKTNNWIWGCSISKKGKI